MLSNADLFGVFILHHRENIGQGLSYPVNLCRGVQGPNCNGSNLEGSLVRPTTYWLPNGLVPEQSRGTAFASHIGIHVRDITSRYMW